MGEISQSMSFDQKAVMNYSDDEILNILIPRFSERLELYFPELESSKVEVTGTAWSGQDGITRIFRLEIDAGDSTRFVFIKLCSLLERYNPAIVEYETLKLLHDKMPEALSVSRPLDIYEDLNAYVMESVGKNNFKHYLLKSNSKLLNKDSDRALISAVSGCARWLRAFHSLADTGTKERFDIISFTESRGKTFDYRRLSDFGFKKTTIMAIEELMERLSSLNGTFVFPCAKQHGDYTPSHVYIDNDHISVIDILGFDNAPIYEDIGRFTASMSMVNTFPFYPLFDYNKCHSILCDVFINAYFSDSNIYEDVFFLFSNVYKLKNLIRWFGAQYLGACIRTHPIFGKIFAETILVGRYEKSIAHVINEASKRLNRLESLGDR
jgi:hypothetical protein